jgi:NTP pyrophosphatase (non-canonical NTP hydrolase)
MDAMKTEDVISLYRNFARTTAIYPEAGMGTVPELMYLALGLAGEAGEVANHIKKVYRDGDDAARRERLASELGDVFWYLVRLVDALGLDPEQVIQANVDKLSGRKARGTLGGSGEER